MILTNRQLLVVTICLVLNAISCDAGHPAGVEFKTVKPCGPSGENIKFKVSPWPFIQSGERMNVTFSFTPVVDVFAATLQYEVTSVTDGRILGRGRDNACPNFPELCSLPAGEPHVWTYTDVMRAFPPGFKLTIRAKLQLYNEEDFMFLCMEIVGTIH